MGFFADKQLDLAAAIVSKNHVEGVFSSGGSYFSYLTKYGGEHHAKVKANLLMSITGPDVRLQENHGDRGYTYTAAKISRQGTIELGSVQPFSHIE